MARTNLPTTALAANSSIADPAGTAIDQANGMNIVLASNAVPSAPSADRLMLRIANSVAAAHNAFIRAGGGVGAGNPPAFRSALGDLTVALPASSTKWAGPFDLARFVQADGSINVDFDASTAGTITAFLMPKNTGN
jgi:hypothetical protein